MRPLDPFDRKAMGLSVGLHTVVFVLAWLGTTRSSSEVEFIAYEIELVSPPPAVQAEEPTVATQELVVETPEPEPAPPEPEEEEAEVVPIEEPAPDPPPEPEPATEPPPDPDEVEVVAAAPDPPPEEEPERSGDGINVRLEGLQRDYPEYYDNIIRQIQRCFRWRKGGNWQTTVSGPRAALKAATPNTATTANAASIRVNKESRIGDESSGCAARSDTIRGNAGKNPPRGKESRM